MPLSLIGTFFVMLALGYSINLLTLLALVLAIGLVVDDAIIVVENVDRHMKAEDHGAARGGADRGARAGRADHRDDGGAGGGVRSDRVPARADRRPVHRIRLLAGRRRHHVRHHRADALADDVLAPVRSAHAATAGSRRIIDRQFDRVHSGYVRVLGSLLATWPVLVVMGVLLLGAVVYLFSTATSELAPQEDLGIVAGQVTGAPDATADQMLGYSRQMFDIARQLPEYSQMFQITGDPSVNQGLGGVMFKPWNQRARGADAIQEELQNKWNSIAGAKIGAFQFPSLPGAFGLPVQFVIATTEPFDRLNEVAKTVLNKANDSHMFWFVDSDLKIDKPQTTLAVDRDLIALLGLNQQDVASSLTSALGGGYVNYFSISGRSYKVIPQVQQIDRLNPSQVLDYYIRTPNEAVVPVRTVGRLETHVVPETIAHFQQLNAVTIIGVPTPFVSQSEVLDYLTRITHEAASNAYRIDYSGPMRQYVQESGGFATTLLFAVIIIYLALAALFESFRDPIVILISVPMALFGALFSMWTLTQVNGILVNVFHISALAEFGKSSTLNIYTQVGLVTLIGLISKHGILIVQFANNLQQAGHSRLDAVIEAAGVRLRPILMTTAAMVLGVLPLVIASGAGAAGRRAMGIVIFTGLSIGTLFTLFVVPAMYAFLAAEHHKRPSGELSSAPALSHAD